MDLTNISVADEAFQHKVAELKQHLRSRMNGKVSEQMTNGNLNYAINYGVSLQHIKQLAAQLQYTPDECSRLWQLNIREAMIIAAINMPTESATTDLMLQWTQYITTPEMVEQGAFFLFHRVSDIDAFVSQLAALDNNYSLALALFSTARALQKGRTLSTHVLNTMVTRLSTVNTLTSTEAAGASMFLRQTLRSGLANATQLKSLLEIMASSDVQYARQVAFEVQNEIDMM